MRAATSPSPAPSSSPSRGGSTMSAQRTSPLGSFSPLFRGMYSDQQLRVSDAERQAVTDRLSEHYAEGRLDQAEFDDRSGRALSAKTRADLNGLFDDLPAPAVPPSDQLPQIRSRRRAHPGMVLVLIVLIALTAGHAVAWIW